MSKLVTAARAAEIMGLSPAEIAGADGESGGEPVYDEMATMALAARVRGNLVTATRAAEIIGCSRAQVNVWQKSGRLKGFVVEGGDSGMRSGVLAFDEGVVRAFGERWRSGQDTG